MERSDVRFLPSSPRAFSMSGAVSPVHYKQKKQENESFAMPCQSDGDAFIVKPIPLVLNEAHHRNAPLPDLETISWKKGAANRYFSMSQNDEIHVFQFDSVSSVSTPDRRAAASERSDRLLMQFRHLVETVRKLQLDVHSVSLSVITYKMRITDYAMQVEKLQKENQDVAKLNAVTKYDHV